MIKTHPDTISIRMLNLRPLYMSQPPTPAIIKPKPVENIVKLLSQNFG
jgi:hypothetical protein